MIRSAPICFAERTPSSPTAPSPTTTVAPGVTNGRLHHLLLDLVVTREAPSTMEWCQSL
jgi:hypothetical protein